MAKIVIDINDKDYKLFMELMSGNLWRSNYQNIIGKCLDAIKHGKVLPKGYGRLGDLTKLYNEIDARNKGKNKGKYTGILALVTFADTIIEADKEV